MMKNWVFFVCFWNIQTCYTVRWWRTYSLSIPETSTILLCSEMVNWAFFVFLKHKRAVMQWYGELSILCAFLKPIQTCCYAETIHWDFWKPNQLWLKPRELQFTELNVHLWHKHWNGNACKFFRILLYNFKPACILILRPLQAYYNSSQKINWICFVCPKNIHTNDYTIKWSVLQSRNTPKKQTKMKNTVTQWWTGALSTAETSCKPWCS